MRLLNRMKTHWFLILLSTLLAGAACAAKDSCFDCHRVMEGMSRKFTNDIHFASALSCADCHGGDPNESNQNVAMNASRGFKVRVTRQGVPEFCGRCHSDAKLMARYHPDPRVDQLARYQAGVHGKLLAAGRKRAAECGDCHSVHDTRAVDDPRSPASPQRISATCAKCHAATGEAFAATKHGKVFINHRRPGCTACHASHETESPTTAMLTGSASVCVHCHKEGSEPMKLAEDMAKILLPLEAGGADTKDALARARVAVHTLDLAAVKTAAQPIAPTPITADAPTQP